MGLVVRVLSSIRFLIIAIYDTEVYLRFEMLGYGFKACLVCSEAGIVLSCFSICLRCTVIDVLMIFCAVGEKS